MPDKMSEIREEDIFIEADLEVLKEKEKLERRFAIIRRNVRAGEFEVAKAMLNQWDKLDAEEKK
jgi:hypothetical protein